MVDVSAWAGTPPRWRQGKPSGSGGTGSRWSYRLIDVLRAVGSSLPRALVTPHAFVAVARIAESAPDVTDSFGFECRLQARATEVDLGMAITAPGRGAIPVGANRAAGGSSELSRCEPWRAIQSLCARWAHPASRINRWVPFLFLEFDTNAARQPVPVPSVFVSLDWPLLVPDFPSNGSRAGASRNASGLQAAMDAAALLLDSPLTKATRAKLSACFMNLPYDGRVVHVGVMLGRNPDVLRLSVSAPRCDVETYLTRIDWPPWSRDFRNCLREFTSRGDRVHFEFDVGTEIGSTLGVILSNGSTPRSVAAFKRRLDQLVAAGRCTLSKRDALLAWPGTTIEKLPGCGFPCALRRDLSHVKVVCAPTGLTEAKAYLTVTPRTSFFK